MAAQLLASVADSARALILEHEHDARELLLDVFAARARVIVAFNTARSASRSVANLRAAVDAERELNANLKGALEREIGTRRSAEQLGGSAVDASEHWRRVASHQAMELADLAQAHDIARDSAVFWKARAICAAAAIKQLTSEDYDFAAFPRRP